MKFFRKNLNASFIRICRIQISSPQRNQNLYPNHYYKIKCHLDSIYNPNSRNYINESILELYLSNTNQLFFTSNRLFRYKLIEENGNNYIDIGITINSFDNNILVDIESVNDGTITFYCDKATESEYTRIDFIGTNINMALKNTCINQYINGGSTLNYTLAKTINKIHDGINNITTYISNADLFNANNDSMTVTITNTDDYTITISVYAKRNCSLFIENY